MFLAMNSSEAGPSNILNKEDMVRDALAAHGVQEEDVDTDAIRLALRRNDYDAAAAARHLIARVDELRAQRAAEELEKEEEEREAKRRKMEEEATLALIAQLQAEDEAELGKRVSESAAAASDDAQLAAMLQREEEERIRVEQLQNEMAAKALEEEDRKRIEAEYAKQTYDCLICMTECALDEMYTLETCDHRFCRDCIATGTRIKITEGEIDPAQMRCPLPDCGKPLARDDVLFLFADEPGLVEKYDKFVLNNSLDSMPDVRYCPKCNVAMVIEIGNPRMTCPDEMCQYASCDQCKVEWHAGSTCDEYQQWAVENAQADDKFEEWKAKVGAKPCPHCGKLTEKKSGCNKMTCRCKKSWCWMCGVPIVGYNHFEDRSNPCQTYS